MIKALTPFRTIPMPPELPQAYTIHSQHRYQLPTHSQIEKLNRLLQALALNAEQRRQAMQLTADYIKLPQNTQRQGNTQPLKTIQNLPPYLLAKKTDKKLRKR